MPPLSSTAYETPVTAYKTPEWAATAVAEGKDPADAGRVKVWINSIVSTAALSVGLALSSWVNDAQAQNAAIICDPAIATKAMERHQIRIKLAKEGWDAIDVKALEANMNSRVASLCAIDIQTKADKQAAAADKQAAATIMAGAQVKEERAAADKQAAAADKQAAAADKQAAAEYREMSDIMNRIEKWATKPTDLARLTELYKSVVRTASVKEREQDLPIIASVLRKLGVAV